MIYDEMKQKNNEIPKEKIQLSGSIFSTIFGILTRIYKQNCIRQCGVGWSTRHSSTILLVLVSPLPSFMCNFKA